MELNLTLLSGKIPATPKLYSQLVPADVQTNFNLLYREVARYCRVPADLDAAQLETRGFLNALPQSCTEYQEEFRRAGVDLVSGGGDGLAALRSVARYTQAVLDAEDSGPAAENIAEALALLLKSYLILDLVTSDGADAFRVKYSQHRQPRDGHFPVAEPATFVHQLARPGRYVALDTKLLAIIGGLIGVDFLVLRVRRDLTQQGGAFTSIIRVHVAADPDALQRAAQFRLAGSPAPALQEQPRPVLPLLETVETEARRCIFRALRPRPGILRQASQQVTNWLAAEDLRIWLPDPTNHSVPLSSLRNLDYEAAAGVFWTVVRHGHSTLVLQRKRRGRQGLLETDTYFGDVPVAELVPGGQGERGTVVRLLKREGQQEDDMRLQPEKPAVPPAAAARRRQPLAAGQEAAAAAAAGQQPAPDAEQPAAAAVTGMDVDDAEMAAGGTEGQQQHEQRAAETAAAQQQRETAVLEAAALQAAQGVGRSENIRLLAQENAAVQAASHKSAKESGALLVRTAEELKHFDQSRPMMHLAAVSNAGSGKTTLINKTIAEVMAAPDVLRRVLPVEVHGPLDPATELPSEGTTVADFLRLFGLGELAKDGGGGGGAADATDAGVGGDAGGVQRPMGRFSAVLKPLPSPPAYAAAGSAAAAAADLRFAAGGEFDFFDLQRHGVAEDVAARLARGWDEQPHVEDAGGKYNQCKPQVQGQEFGCFMPNGLDLHCTDRVQNVYMPVADRLDAATFRFCLGFRSREEVNRQIYEFRRRIIGEIDDRELSDIAPEAYVNVPILCGLGQRGNDDGEGNMKEKFEALMAIATRTDDELEDEDEAVTAEDREGARQKLLAQLYPLKRYERWLGHAVEFRLLTDDTVGASRWAEFFSTRFILGNENAVFTLTGHSAMHVPSGHLPLHIMDIPGVDRQPNVLQANELNEGLRAILANACNGHTIIVLPSTGREASMSPAVSVLQRSRVLQAAIDNPGSFTLVPVVNLRPGSLVIGQKMVDAPSAAAFLKAYKAMDFPNDFLKRFKNKVEETAKDIGQGRQVAALLRDNQQLVVLHVLDVGCKFVECMPYRDDPQVAGFLVASFVRFVNDTYQRSTAAARAVIRNRMWQQLGCVAFEGLGLAKRLQRPRGGGGGGAAEDPATDDDEDGATSQTDTAKNLKKVANTLKEVLKLQEELSAGERRWEAQVRELWRHGEQGVMGPDETAPVAALIGVGGPPLTLEGITAWVEGPDSQLKQLLQRCTQERAKKVLDKTTWGAAYQAKHSRKLGNDLNSSNLVSDDNSLSAYLISRFRNRGEGIVASMLRRVVTTIINVDILLVKRQIRNTRRNMEINKALKADLEAQLLLDVFDESISELLNRKKEEVLRQLDVLSLQTLPARWLEALNTEAARAVAAEVYQKSAGRRREVRLEKARTELLEAWKESLMPGQNDGRGPVAAIIVDLARHVLQEYRHRRSRVIREAVEAAKSSTVATLGPMALHVVNAGLEAAALTTAARQAATASEPLLKELQKALQAAKEVKKARMQVLSAKYDCGDPLELVEKASEDQGLRDWAEEAGM